MPKIVSKATLPRCLELEEARYLFSAFEKSINPEAGGVFSQKVPWVESKTNLHSQRGTCLSSLELPRNPCAGELTLIPLVPAPADLKKEKQGATQKSFHSNHRNAHGAMSL